MPFVSVTRLRIRSARFLPFFFVNFLRARRQVARSPGFMQGSLLVDRHLTFWTMTAWADEPSMRDYMMSGAHRAVMPRLVDWCDEASVAHWEELKDALPSWRDAETRMRESGRSSRVRHPSSDHSSKNFSPVQVVAVRRIRPAKADH